MRDWSAMKKLIWSRAYLAGGVLTTVTGSAPLSLPGALARAINKLIRYGLCEQADTPTPDAPVDIVCNNGALRMVDNELPAAYKRVLGFSMNNNSFWEISDFPLYGSDTLRFSFDASDACNVIGAYSGSASGNNYSMYVGSSSNYLRYKSGAYNSGVTFGDRYDVEITPTGSHGMKTDSTWTEQEFTTPTNLCIGTTSTTASSAKLKGTLYGNIEVVGRAKFVPCERIADSVLGYYDLIGGAFYEQASGYSGAVSLGYDGSHYARQTIGTAEVLTVAEQTASVVDLLSVGTYKDEQDLITGAITRRVGVKVFDGTEAINQGQSMGSLVMFTYSLTQAPSGSPGLFCSHYKQGIMTLDAVMLSSRTLTFTVSSTDFASATDFKAFLAAQYAAGTPVIVLYPLATAATESVAAQPLSTVAGDNTVSATLNVSKADMEVAYYTPA